MKDNKFILTSLNDENSKNIAEVLKSDKTKKILDFLSDVKEASEKDIAKGLNIPINTIEYNLKKLIKTGLIKTSKNFFWSVKGKKIPMYKLAKKHIIISPDKKPNLKAIKTLLPLFAIISLAIILSFLSQIPLQETTYNQTELKQFTSYNELKEFLKENSENQNYFSTQTRTLDETFAEASTTGTAPKSEAKDYSTTNIQVKGVDEADIVKNDGKYIYLVSDNKVYIVNAYPAEEMKIISEIELEKYAQNIYLNKDKLIIYQNSYSPILAQAECIDCINPSKPSTKIIIYNIENKSNPQLEKSYTIDGNYQNSRMIENKIYTITNKYINTQTPDLPIYYIQNTKVEIPAQEINYFPYPDTNYVFTFISSIDLENQNLESEVYLTGSSNTIYVSKENIYLTSQKRINNQEYNQEFAEQVAMKLLPEKKSEIQSILESNTEPYKKTNQINNLITTHSMSLKGEEKSQFDRELVTLTEEFEINIQKKMQKTIIHKINIKDKIEYQTFGEVPGIILNQFSMDEFNGNFRIATTTGNSWNGNSLNHLYVLNQNLEIIGKIEDIAKGEKIYSARFIDEKAYLVTFKQIDPFYVIDLSKPEKPETLGELKITGYSSYLHPYDKNHIIGIGIEANEQGRTQGLKIALFDVTDVENPTLKSKFQINEKWSYSEALYNHKAFLFDKKKEILVIPLSYTEKTNESYNQWNGAYVFNINQQEISLKGKILHKSENSWKNQIRRSLYMDNTIYTISQALLKANNLNTLTEIKSIKFPYEKPEKSINYREVETTSKK